MVPIALGEAEPPVHGDRGLVAGLDLEGDAPRAGVRRPLGQRVEDLAAQALSPVVGERADS
ncbi:hypothetical protein L0U85_12875 [Glycomyces sp. L485]|uniref:hypothetical protein n=1 Tax=Glycomyces sp. L485 TaxID=2909235 RepID=UPI001F4B40B9|nr:hypothetical protein [Glycomyces sp. L485]MCH7231738.1 hypothetical protein [Glycomyces sp. L485]